MFDRILKIKEPIIATLAILNNTELNSLTPNEWQVLDKSKELLKIFYDITREVLNMAKTLKEKMMIRFDRIEDNLLNAQATILDPQQSSSSAPEYSNSAIWEDFDKSVVNAIGGNNSTAAGIIEPRLYEIVKTRLCIIATSVPCERLFSKAGQVITDRRNRLLVVTSSFKFQSIVFYYLLPQNRFNILMYSVLLQRF